jgi:hypothetical protein
MKKTLSILAMVAIATTAFAQVDMTTKRGEQILPETGNYAFGVDAWPFLDYAGQLMNGSSGPNSVYFQSPVDMSGIVLYGKYVKDPGTHYRGKARIGFGSDKVELPVAIQDADGNFTDPMTYGVDEYKVSGNAIVLGAGIEKRRGQGRLQGYYGPEVCVGFGGSKETHTYANAIGMNNQMPLISGDWGSNGTPSNPYLGNARITETNNGSTFFFGLHGFVGVEYFFMAKASIGAEFGWGLRMESSGAEETSTEEWDSTDDVLVTETLETEGSQSSFGFDTMVDGTNSMYTSVRLLFYW